MTQLLKALNNKITPEMEAIALKEDVDVKTLMQNVADGKVVILKNKNHENVISTAVGEGLTIKVNANIGTSMQRSSIEQELNKLKIIEQAGADTVMDLSTGANLDETD